MKLSLSVASVFALSLAPLRTPALFALIATWTAGCSSFERAWREAEHQPRATNSIAGPWKGTWRSEANGHNDQLRCILTPLTNGIYAARFHARYKKVIPFTFSYTVPLTATNASSSEKVPFRGSANLGWYAGGIYSYEGTASLTNFFSTYDSKYDRGTFQMTRPPATK
jgi:hypothetical protein